MKPHNRRVWWYVILLMTVLSACEEEETLLPNRIKVEDAVFASGYIEQENEYSVAAKVEGILLSLPLAEGDEVIHNDLIATIESEVQQQQLRDALVVHQDAINKTAESSPQLLQIQTQIEQAQQQLTLDEESYQRYKDLRDKNSVSQLDLEKAELQYQSAQSNLTSLRESYTESQQALQLGEQRSLVQVNTQQALLRDYQLRAEAAGTMIKVNKKRGELVRRGETIATIGSGAYIIKLFVAEDDITKIDIGQAVSVHINTYPNRTFPAAVSKTYPGFDEMEQSYIVEARFEQLPEKMFSGTQLQANIEIGTRENVLVIPTNYITRGNYVLLGTGEEVPIVTGTKNSTWTEVISGITEADVIQKPTP